MTGSTAYRGIRYAKAGRFGPPVVLAWDGRAPGDGPIAPQSPSRLRAAMGDFVRPMDEDCLTLTIWTPEEPGEGRAVLVWLHGGAWISGAGSLEWYDGGRLAAEQGIVVVGVNYRLGALGYLFHPEVGVMNPGSLDQLAALRWVKENIAAFGGDAGRVTVAGQSAGASSIGRLMLEGTGLFGQVVLQSGSFGRPPLTAADAAGIAEAFCGVLGVTPAGLRDVPVGRLVEAQGVLARQMAKFGETNPPFMPVLAERMTQPGLIAAIARAGRGMRVMLGATREEVHAFYAADPAMAEPGEERVAARFAALGGDLAAYRRRRPGGSVMDLLADLASDHTFLWPTMRLAEAFSAEGVPAFAYQFDWAPAGSRFRACHCIELPFVFGTFPAWDAPMLEGGDVAEMEALSVRMRGCWGAFVREGSPGGDWPEYDLARRLTMRFDDVVAVCGDPAGMETRR